MYYQGGTTAKYQMADRMRQAERARTANEAAARKGPGPARRVAATVMSLLVSLFKS
jgi:hypothetical protein